MENKCRGCTERTVTCHSTCEDYQKRFEAQQERYAEKEKNRIYSDYVAKRYRDCVRNPKKSVVERWKREREAAK